MARYKEYSYEQAKLIPISFQQQIVPGTFEYTLNYLIDREFDLSVFAARYHNDETGAPAYDPAILKDHSLRLLARDCLESRDRPVLPGERDRCLRLFSRLALRSSLTSLKLR
jgi:hypothetical protein